MGNENHQHHHQLYHQRSTFLPMLCSRPSIKDVSLPRWINRPSSTCHDPLSPRIGCMGQVKRNNKIAGFPTSHRLSFTSSSKSSTTTSPVVKLKKLFSAKNLSTATTTTASTARQRVVSKNHKCNRNENLVPISIDDMDPPLPVIKRVPKFEEGGNMVDSLWKRRSGAPAIKSLQLQQIHHPRICLQPPTV
ncbi:uncharacterized protein LOC133295673 [Gastrolobium bilobum]|uniref:uncharacterized protein LOC133295673 n=1 Tax=Gastrolobium bilobum TaxID=150636 RepID=UPI002AB0B915|nr:uncharacterized protein LOC133295673 [Gastrolobium bilobum]